MQSPSDYLFKILICMVPFLYGHGSSSFLNNQIEKAKNGDYLVLEGGKMITILSFRSITAESMILEEINIPAQNLKQRPSSWADWIKVKAPGHTSWTMIELERSSGEILESYSFTRLAWFQISSQESFIATLLTLPLQAVPIERWRRIGPPPASGELDTRQIWKPPVVFEGKKRENIELAVYETTWPKDDSDLSGHTITLYFDQNIRFPFPFWIQIETSQAQIPLRTIDAGRGFPSPHHAFPRRIPKFIGQPQKMENGLKLTLKSPKYFHHFELFAIDVTNKEKQIFPISHSLIKGKDEFLTIEIKEDELNDVLQPDHRYTWLLVPLGHGESYTESQKPFTWSATR